MSLIDRNTLTAHLEGKQEHQIGALVLDASERTWKTNQPQTTNFLDPHERQVARSVLDGIPEVSVSVQGGYPRAERARLVIYPRLYPLESIAYTIRALEAVGNFAFCSVSHKDFLGALLATGLKREMIGDIIVTADGCQVITAAEVADYLLTHWTGVRSVPVKVSEIDPDQLAVEPERVKEIRSTVASLRLDAVAASGFGTSRTKIARDIKNERVKVNFRPVSNPAHAVQEGDTLSIRGRGRVVIESIPGKSRKGRFRLLLKRLM